MIQAFGGHSHSNQHSLPIINPSRFRDPQKNCQSPKCKEGETDPSPCHGAFASNGKFGVRGPYLLHVLYNSREIKLSVPEKGTWIQVLTLFVLQGCKTAREKARALRRGDCLVGCSD